MGVKTLISPGVNLVTQLDNRVKYGLGSRIVSLPPKRPSFSSWMPERLNRWLFGVGCRHPMTMHKASFGTLSMRRACAQ